MSKRLTAALLLLVFSSSGALAQEMVLARGSFTDYGQHAGAGAVTLEENADGDRSLNFTAFEVDNGPDLKVWLVSPADEITTDSVKAGQYVALGALQSPAGDQKYAVPGNVDLSQYGAVAIWCEQFSVLFSAAKLER